MLAFTCEVTDLSPRDESHKRSHVPQHHASQVALLALAGGNAGLSWPYYVGEPGRGMCNVRIANECPHVAFAFVLKYSAPASFVLGRCGSCTPFQD